MSHPRFHPGPRADRRAESHYPGRGRRRLLRRPTQLGMFLSGQRADPAACLGGGDFAFGRIASTAIFRISSARLEGKLRFPSARLDNGLCPASRRLDRDLCFPSCSPAHDELRALRTDLVVMRAVAARGARFVLRRASGSSLRVGALGLASNVRGGVASALESEATALPMLTIRALPASNMLSRSNGPAALTVSRRGFSARMILTLVGWQSFHSAGLRGHRDKRRRSLQRSRAIASASGDRVSRCPACRRRVHRCAAN